MYQVLQLDDLEPGRLRAAFDRVAACLAAGDFRAAQVKKLRHGPYYRAELSAADRLIFRFGRHREQACLLLLEIVENHDYAKSRFLRGAAVDESRLEPWTDSAVPPDADRAELPYLHPGRARFHLLDKILSFDDDQHEAFHAPPPLILIGSAGSGKTALVLERIKRLDGEVLYVTRSPFLVENARSLYFSEGFDRDGQEVDFLSFAEYLESLRVPPGKAVDARRFAAWMMRHRAASPIKDSHRLFEEFSGVITGAAADRPWLSREDYLSLGIRRSIFLADERPHVYALFEKYRDWLAEGGLHDVNVESFRALESCAPAYDHVVVDEVQDLTNVQLTLILRSLRDPAGFLLCGDANQIVHPNFFSWSALKSLFYAGRPERPAEIIRILSRNYRNAPAVTDFANRILRVKQARFGSVDRESNYLVRSRAAADGAVEAVPDEPAMLRRLDEQTGRSTRFAVLVLREEDKPAARAAFHTPLLFSVQEAKGLEYENVILFRFLAAAAREYREIAEGVEAGELAGELRYARARDKADKSLDAYKFFVNALYVAATRAVRNLYVVEPGAHPLLPLLGLREARRDLKVAARASTAEEWRAEARRLELQGKEDQAAEIRRTLLGQQPVPWRVLTPANLADLEREALDPARFNKHAKTLLFEYAVVHAAWPLLGRLAELKFTRAMRWTDDRPEIDRKYRQDYLERTRPELRRKLALYGVDFRDPLNRTPLMIAAEMGEPDLLRELVAAGADLRARDNAGRTALQIALRQSFADPAFAARRIGTLYPILAPPDLKVRIGDRIHKFDQHRREYFVLNAMLSVLSDLLRTKMQHACPGFQTGDIIHGLVYFPEHVVPAHRRDRSAVTAVLAAHEMQTGHAGSRDLFVRLRRGYYLPHPDLSVAVGEDWVNVYDLVGLAAMAADKANYPSAAELIRFFDSVRGLAERRAKTLADFEAALARDGQPPADEGAPPPLALPPPPPKPPRRYRRKPNNILKEFREYIERMGPLPPPP